MEQIATVCDWDPAGKILMDFWNHPTETRDQNARIRLRHAIAEVDFGVKDYAHTEEWCRKAVMRERVCLE
jgi:hypothetical protein